MVTGSPAPFYIIGAVIAQLVEQPPCKRQVVGSSPTHGSIFYLYGIIKVMLTIILSSLLIVIAGCLLHFTYDWSNKNKFVAVFSAVNESVWEHIKIALVPTFIFCFFSPLFYDASSKGNFIVASTMCVLAIILVIPTLFYIVSALTRRHSIAAGIIEFCIAILLSQIVFAIAIQGVRSGGCNSYGLCTEFYYSVYSDSFVLVSGIIFVLTIIATLVFTYFPPKNFLFRDPRNGKYGLAAANKHHTHKRKTVSRKK